MRIFADLSSFIWGSLYMIKGPSSDGPCRSQIKSHGETHFPNLLLSFAKKADIIRIVILLVGWKPHGYGIFSSPLWGVVPPAKPWKHDVSKAFALSSEKSKTPYVWNIFGTEIFERSQTGAAHAIFERPFGISFGIEAGIAPASVCSSSCLIHFMLNFHREYALAAASALSGTARSKNPLPS